MSIAPPGPPEAQFPPPVEPKPTHKDAKAQAAAAKAYAKAQRPWWKMKRVLIPAGLIAVAAIGGASSSSSGPTLGTPPSTASAPSGASGGGSTTSASAGGSVATASGGSSSDTAYVGQPIENAGTRYEVTSAKTTDLLTDGYSRERPDGVFVVVNLELTNTKDETATFMESNARLVTTDGKAYDTSDSAFLALPSNRNLMMEDIQPDLTKKGTIVFDVPPAKVSGATLVLEDLWGDGEAKVNLGL